MKSKITRGLVYHHPEWQQELPGFEVPTRGIDPRGTSRDQKAIRARDIEDKKLRYYAWLHKTNKGLFL